jgi:hypothetical protein
MPRRSQLGLPFLSHTPGGSQKVKDTSSPLLTLLFAPGGIAGVSQLKFTEMAKELRTGYQPDNLPRPVAEEPVQTTNYRRICVALLTLKLEYLAQRLSIYWQEPAPIRSGE